MNVIDTHAHFIPASVVAEVERGDGPDGTTVQHRDGVPWMVHRQGYVYPLHARFHDVQARLDDMAEGGITHAVLSVPPTFFFYGTPAAEGVDTARRLNDALAETVATGDGRLAAIATLPMQDPVAAAAELRRASVDLGMKGAEIGPNVEGVALDSSKLEPVLEAANELDAPLIVHPYYVGNDPVLHDFYMTNLLGNPWQTTVCATRLVLSGTLDRLRRLRLLLVHGGGYLPAALGRLDHGFQVRPELTHMTTKPSEYRWRFSYDTLTHDPVALRWLLESVGDRCVVFGSDAPFDMGGPSLAEQLGSEPLPGHTVERIACQNAEALFDLDVQPGRLDTAGGA